MIGFARRLPPPPPPVDTEHVPQHVQRLRGQGAEATSFNWEEHLPGDRISHSGHPLYGEVTAIKQVTPEKTHRILDYTIEDAARAVQYIGEDQTRWGIVGGEQAWFGGRGDDVAHRMRFGDPTHANTISAAYDQVCDILLRDTEGRSIEPLPDVVGSSPRVPEYIAGMPLDMSRCDEDRGENPVHVYIHNAVNGQIQPKTVALNGAVAIAIASVISMVRPVEVYVVFDERYDGHEIYGRIKLGVSPFDATSLAGILCNVGVMRYLLVYHYLRVFDELYKCTIVHARAPIQNHFPPPEGSFVSMRVDYDLQDVQSAVDNVRRTASIIGSNTQLEAFLNEAR